MKGIFQYEYTLCENLTVVFSFTNATLYLLLNNKHLNRFDLGKPVACGSLWALVRLLATNLSWERPQIFFVCIWLARWNRSRLSSSQYFQL